jgi:hypothetical protein
MARVDKAKAAKAGGFLWRYRWALYRCMGELAPPPERRLAQEIEDGT